MTTIRTLAVLIALMTACQKAHQPPAATGADPGGAPEATPAPQPDTPTADGKPSGLDLDGMQKSTPAGQDFYRYANGTWDDNYQLKSDEMRYGAMIALHYRSEDQLKAILDELSASDAASGTSERQLADYFASYMNLARLNELGIAPLKDDLKKVSAIKSKNQLMEAFGQADLLGTESPIGAGVSIDRMDPDRHMLLVSYSGLGLPDRAYYLEDAFAKLREEYEKTIAIMLGFTGEKPAAAEQSAKAVLALETEIARHHWPRERARNADLTYNKTTVAALEKEHPTFAWKRFLTAQGIDPKTLGDINLATPDAIGPLVKLVHTTPLATWRAYLTFHMVHGHAHLLGDAIDDANFAFFGRALGGQPEQRDRWKRGLALVGADSGLGEALGKLYVERHFSPESKQAMEALVQNLRTAFQQRIQALSWMGDDTKRAALEKLSTFTPKIGYPDKWRDFSSIAIVPDDLMANYRAVRAYWHADSIARLGKPTDRAEWQMTPQTVNAYYNPTFNEIVFPAAILQAPFFELSADPAVNYGAIGAVIGHEMSHGFDDQGSKFDARGVQRNWWSDADRTRFEAMAKRVVEQYGQFEPVPGHKLNGQLTVGENIGDLGGMAIAHQAYRIALAGQPAPVLDGLTGEQRFFLSWAQIWRDKARPELALMRIKSDPHSPGPVRVNAVVHNMNDWYDAFGVQKDQALYLKPEDRVQIW